MYTLKGKNIFLRALELEDINYLFSIENNEKYWSISDSQIPFSKYLLNRYLKNSDMDIYEAKQLRLVIVDLKNTPVGLIDLFDFDPYNNRAGIGILIADKNNRGQGYSKYALKLFLEYAFNHLGLHQVFANVTSDNKISIDLFSSLNFKKIGVKKDWLKKGKSYQDEILFQCIR